MIKFVLDKTITELDISMNKLAVEAKIRPNTINDINKGLIQRMDLDTLNTIIDTLNFLGRQKGIERRYDINDIMLYEQIKKPTD